MQEKTTGCRVRYRKQLSSFSLKLIAIISMTVDHIGVLLLSGDVAIICRAIGRLAFPIFCFLLVEGYIHTRRFDRYLLRLGVFAFLCESIYDYTFFRSVPAWQDQNIFVLLFLGLLMMFLLDKTTQFCSEKNWVLIYRNGATAFLQCVVFAVLAALAVFFRANYGIYGMAVIAIFYLLRTNPILRAMAFIIVVCVTHWQDGWVQFAALLALVPIGMYSGERGYKLKYTFYIYYPLHLLIIAQLMIVPLVGIGVVADVNHREAVVSADLFKSIPVMEENGNPELFNAIVQNFGSWGEVKRALLLDPELVDGEIYGYTDIFMSNGAPLLLCSENVEGWYLSAGNIVNCSFAVSQESLSINSRENVNMLFFPVLNGNYIELKDGVAQGSVFSFAFTVPSEGMYYFGIMNASSDKIVVEDISLKIETGT
ncbi:MAG: conjugal transfer protein TraX [Lachnospiraceae bacterium]|nr:conjugal transfer protein TraX [Lachnospiraceae bacterium]